MRYAPIFSIFFLITGSAVAGTSDSQSEKTKEAVSLISETADRICNENFSQTSESKELSIDGSVDANILLLAKQLGGLGIDGAGTYKEAKSHGVVQQDLAQAVRAQSDCKQGVFYKLLELFIPSSRNVNPFVASSDKLQVPEPLSSVKSGQRFAMKKNDARLISGTNMMITLASYSTNTPPVIWLRFTDLIKGTNGRLNPALGDVASFENCRITYYAASKEEQTASFFLSCS